MKKNTYLIAMICFLFIGKVIAQSDFTVDYSEIKGSLSKSDKYKVDFGKYRGYEIPLYQGETANFLLYSNEFNGKIILVDPEGNIFKQTAEASNGFNSIITSIPKSGDWIIYIVGDQKDNGKFVLRYAMADQHSMNYNSNMDFCSTINFLIAHANAQFMMLQMNSTNSEIPKLPGTKESFIDAESSAFVNIISEASESNIKNSFDQYSNQIKNCLPDWKTNISKTTVENKLILRGDEDVTIMLECFPETTAKDNYQLILKISKVGN